MKLAKEKHILQLILVIIMEYYLALFLLVPFVCATIIHVLISNLGIKTQKSPKLPPGPNPYPIIGNILELGKNQPHIALTNLSQIYGPIMSLKLGTTTTMVISSPKFSKEILQTNDQKFSYRKFPDTSTVYDDHILSMLWLPPTTQWRNLRRICATKIFSPQKLNSTQVIRQRKVKELLDFVSEKCKKGESLDIGDACFTTVLNSISNTLFSLDLAHYYTPNKSQEFRDIIWGIMEEGGKPNIVDSFPILRFLDPQGAYRRMKNYRERLNNIIGGLIEERLKSRELKKNQARNDVLDSVLDILGEDPSQLSHDHLLSLFKDLFVAGIDTTSSTIEWAMTELLHNSDKLEILRKELQQVLSKGEQFEESLISKLPFLRAVVKETLRMHPPAPFLLPHMSQEDVEICGYMVPKNAQIIINVWAMGRDSSIWTNPNKFMPERFLESEIDFRGQDFELTPFGAGRRICPGMPLAFRSIHLVLASLLYNYDWKLGNGLKEKDMDMSEKFGLTLNKAHPLKLIPIQV